MVAVLLLNPVSLMVIGMSLSSMHEQEYLRQMRERTPEASELVCYAVAPSVVARIEAGLTIPGGHIQEARAVHSAENPEEWFIAALVTENGCNPRVRGVAVWRLITAGDPHTGAGAPEAAIATAGPMADATEAFVKANMLSVEVSHFPLKFGLRPDLEHAAEACIPWPPRKPPTPTPATIGGQADETRRWSAAYRPPQSRRPIAFSSSQSAGSAASRWRSGCMPST